MIRQMPTISPDAQDNLNQIIEDSEGFISALGDNKGICLACGEEAYNVEPDAEISLCISIDDSLLIICCDYFFLITTSQ